MSLPFLSPCRFSTMTSTHIKKVLAFVPRRNFSHAPQPRSRSYFGSILVTPSSSTLSLPRHAPSLIRTIFIRTETTPNDNSLKFSPGIPVMTTGSAEFLDTRSALVSPLAIRLMGIKGVNGVFYGPDFVTVSKDPDSAWSSIKPEISSTLMEHFTLNQPLFYSGEGKTSVDNSTDSETVAMIKELLETRIRPSIMEDGGDIEYKGFDEGGSGVVKLILKGSCRGCDSSTVTLKSGIERMLMHYIPEVKGVEQVLGEDEAINLDEFSKFEQRLAEKEAKSEWHGSRLYNLKEL